MEIAFAIIVIALCLSLGGYGLLGALSDEAFEQCVER